MAYGLSVVSRRELVRVMGQEFRRLGVQLVPGSVAAFVDELIGTEAAWRGLTPASVLRDLSVSSWMEAARPVALAFKESEIPAADAALVVSAFARAAKVAVLNGDLSVCADLCEVVAVAGGALCNPPPMIPMVSLLLGVEKAELVVQQLVAGFWKTGLESPLQDDRDDSADLVVSLEAGVREISKRLDRIRVQ